jgi:NADPH:quinone reductase-like Zn-dependent oxidoreductase
VQAVVFHEFGGSGVLRLEELPDPRPAPGEVVLDVRACALNHLDVDLREGVSRFPVELPLVLGLEIVGTIRELGEGVTGWEVGERVAPYLLGSAGTFLGVTRAGGYAEQVACPAGMLVRIPDALADVDAAALQVAFGTSWHMLFNRAKLQVGETVLVTSVGSGIGSAAVQLAKRAGAFVIGTSSSDEKLSRAAQDGMDHGINYTTQDVAEEVMRLTDGQGVDVVYEHVGGDRFQEGLASLAFSGRLVTCGAHAQEVVDFDIIPFFRGQKSVIGSFVYDLDELERVLKLAARGMITPVVAATYPLAQAKEAMDLMESRDFFGKIVLTPGGGA